MRFEEADYFSPSQFDFVPRERRNQSGKLVTAFILTIFLVMLLGFIPGLNAHPFIPFLLAGIIGALCFFVVTRNQQNLDLVMTTEHQNLLFSQAVALGTSFCLFVRRNGTIVHADEGMRRLFMQTASESKALESIFENGGISAGDRERIIGSIYNNVSDRLIFPVRDPAGETKQYILTVEPLIRPAGFLLVRGREYRGERSGVQLMPDMLRTTSVDKLDHLLASTPIGHYVTDAFGRVEYANGALEQVLAYDIGDMLLQRVTITKFVQQWGDAPMPDDYSLADYTGLAVLRAQTGEMIDCVLFQSVIRDEANKIVGATGSILLPSVLEA